MNRETLITKLSKYGQVEVFSEDFVLTFLMTGNNLDNSKIFLKINKELAEYAETKGYPHAEVIKNTDKLILIVLKP